MLLRVELNSGRQKSTAHPGQILRINLRNKVFLTIVYNMQFARLHGLVCS